MEPFLRRRLSFLSFVWDKVWPAGAPRFPDPDAAVEPEPVAEEPLAAEPSSAPEPARLRGALPDSTARRGEKPSVRQGGSIQAAREEGGCIRAGRASGWRRAGVVPVTSVAEAAASGTLSDQPWYFSGISRTQAQQLLLSPPNVPGAFLVRPSESSHGDYSLSVRAQAKVHHYRISMAADGSLYLQKDRLFPSLDELLAYYKANWKLIQSPLLQPCVSQVFISGEGSSLPYSSQAGGAGLGKGPWQSQASPEAVRRCRPDGRTGTGAAAVLKPPEPDKWERPHSEFTLRRKLGEGYFGEVWEGLWLGSLPVAVKVVRPGDVKLADLAQEIRTLKSLRHERLIRLHAVCSAGEPVYIVTELMRRGSLQAFLGSPEGQALSPPLLLTFACQVAEGMSYLEEQRIVHRDLAARNVLVGDDLACKVADFGLARLLKDDVYSLRSGCRIPVKWTAPEAASYCVYSAKSDVWSFGVLLYEVFAYGRCPYEGMSNHETLQQVSRGYRLPRPAACPAEVYTLMLGCWRGCPEERPGFAVLREKLGAVSSSHCPALT